MKHYIYCTIISILLPILTTAQERQKIVGKIVSNTRDLEGIIVQNTNTKETAETERGGYFTIEGKEGDQLVFTATHLMGVTHLLKPQDIKKTLLFIPMERSTTVLDEIFIDRSINSESLGFGKPLSYTPLERNLITATTSAAGIIAVDALANAFTGRTKMLKQAASIESESKNVEKLLQKFSTEYFTDYLKIPEKHILAFGYFIHQDSKIYNHLQSRNKNYIDFLMSEKATEFLKKIEAIQ